MGSFTKNFRKRLLRKELERVKETNRYLWERVAELIRKTTQTPSIKEINQQRMDLIRNVLGG